MRRFSSISPGFAESFWQDDREDTSFFPDHLQRSATNLSFHIYVSLYPFTLSLLPCFLFSPLSPSFVFTLTFRRSTQPSPQFRLLSFINRTRRDEPERAALFSVQNHDQLLSSLQRKILNECTAHCVWPRAMSVLMHAILNFPLGCPDMEEKVSMCLMDAALQHIAE